MTKLVVLGGGESGIGAALLGIKEGMSVFLSDSGQLSSAHVGELDAAGIAYEQGGHSAARVLTADLVVKSPGIPDDAPLVKQLREQGTTVISEIEFAGRYSQARFIGITGSNGKTTTTLLIHHILTQAGLKASLAGNVGYSLARQVAQGNEPDWYVVELSSFQLDGMYNFRCNVAILCNITPDHLDRYDHDFGKYAASKYRITQNLTAEDTFVYNADDAATLAYYTSRSARAVPVSLIGRSRFANLVDNELRLDLGATLNVKVEELPIMGRHNLYNALQAMTACLTVGLTPAQVRAGLLTFKNAPHRLEVIRDLDGVLWINDSKATNVDAAWYALEAQNRPVVWIVGGKDKGNDYNDILQVAQEKVKALVCLGADNAKIVNFFTNRLPVVEETHDVASCVSACRRLAAPGDVVLLSPCCASFDLFNGYEQRGDLFRQQVLKEQSLDASR